MERLYALLDPQILMKANATFAHLEPIREPTDEQDILRSRLGEHGFKRKIMEDDGNCVLPSFSDQFWETQERHLEVREAACSQLMRFRHLYGYAVRGNYYDYVDFMSRPCSWADARLTQAACDAYHVRLVELVSLPGYVIHDFIPSDGDYYKIIYFCSSSVHSDSMYRIGDEIPLSPGRMRKMRRTGRFHEPEVVNRGTQTVFSFDMLDGGNCNS